MSINEQCVFAVQKLTPTEREPLGCLVLGMRKRIRYLKPECIHLWIPDLGPSEELLATVHAKKQELLAASAKASGSFRRRRLAPTSLQEWDRFWYEEFASRYRKELHARQSCRVVAYAQTRSDILVQMSPLHYLLSLEAENEAAGHTCHGKVTVMCCEPEGEECHRHVLLADVQAIQAVRQALTSTPLVRLKVRMRGQMAETILHSLLLKGIYVDSSPYLRTSVSSLYAATIHSLEQLSRILEVPNIEGVELMPSLSLSESAIAY